MTTSAGFVLLNVDVNENKKIYSFSVQDREKLQIQINSSRGRKIDKTLCLNDLFSFDVIDKSGLRYNFETFFQKYECSIKSNTLSLIEKVKDNDNNIKTEVFEIFASKFINFIRNPFSIKKVLNTFSILLNYHPTDPELYNKGVQILKGRKPQIQYLCQQLEITDDEYMKWLLVIFMLHTNLDKDGPNFLYQSIQSLFENIELFTSVMVYSYDDESCLVCDRGYVSPIPENEHFAFDFNLTSNTFIRYFFGNIEALSPPNCPREIIELYKASKKQVNVHHFKNDFETLTKYNQNAVYQCFKTVFNSQPKCYGL